MSFQPFQMPNESGMARGMRGLSESLSDLARWKQDQNRLMADNLKAKFDMNRQEEGDFGATVAKANLLLRAGDKKGAHALMSRYGAQADRREIIGPPVPAGPRPAATPDHALSELTDPNAISEAMAGADNAEQKMNPIQAAFQAQNKRYVDTLRGQFKGREWTLDPEAAREASLQRMDAAAQSAGDDPSIKALYPQMRAVSEATGQTLEPGAMFSHLRAHANLESQDARADERERARRDADERRDAEWRQRFELAEAGRNRRAGAAASRAGTVTPSKKVDDDRALANSAASLLNQELGREDYRETIKTARDNSLMIKLLESNNPAAHKRAMGIAAKQGSGPGAVTAEERDYFVNTVGGADNKARQWALNWLSGGEVPEEVRQIFADSYRNILMRHNEEVLSGLRSNVQDMFASHPNEALRQYADWAGNRVAPSILGGGKRANGPGERPMSAKDEAAEKWARSNPRDPRAASILKKLGK